MVLSDVAMVVTHWLTGSDEDFLASKKLQEAEFWGQSLFFLHLSLEKKIKSIIVSQTQEHAPFHHSLTYLIGKTNLVVSQKTIEQLTTMSEFNLSALYPDEKVRQQKLFTKEFVSYWSNIAEGTHQWLNQSLPKI